MAANEPKLPLWGIKGAWKEIQPRPGGLASVGVGTAGRARAGDGAGRSGHTCPYIVSETLFCWTASTSFVVSGSSLTGVSEAESTGELGSGFTAQELIHPPLRK